MQVLRFARALEPRWIVMENVVYMRPWSRYGELIGKLREMGYFIREQVLDASRFGVPQKRHRLRWMAGAERKVPQPYGYVVVRVRQVLEIMARPERF